MEKLVSVVVPVYNVENYLTECLDSITNQTYRNFEVILVDDGSTDGSSQMCDEIAREDERIHVIHKENGGLSDARNTGLRASKGEYIIFIDSDDMVSAIMLEQMVKSMQENNADISTCLFKTFEASKDLRLGDNSVEKITMLEGKVLVKKLYSGEYPDIAFVAWNKLYKRSLFEDNNIEYPVGRFYEDTFTTFKLLYEAEKIAIIDNPFYHYRIRQGSIMKSTITKKKVIDWIAGDREAVDFFIQAKEYELVALAANNFLKSQIILYKKICKDAENGYKVYLMKEYQTAVRNYLNISNFSKPKRIGYRLFCYFPDLICKIY